MRNYILNATWGTLKSDLLSQFKPVDWNRLNHEAIDQCRKRSSNVFEYIKAFRLALLRYDTHVSEEEDYTSFSKACGTKLRYRFWYNALQYLK